MARWRSPSWTRPLYARFGRLERSFPRAPFVRATKVAVVAVLIACGTAPASHESQIWQFVALLGSASLFALVAVGDYAWSVTLVIGVASILFDGGTEQHFSSFLETVPPPAWTACIVASAVAFLRWGPREIRTA